MGIGGGGRIGGPAPGVAGPGMVGANVTGVVRAERPRVGGSAGVAGRGGRGVERAMEECDAGPAPAARVGSGAARVHPAQARGSRDRASVSLTRTKGAPRSITPVTAVPG